MIQKLFISGVGLRLLYALYCLRSSALLLKFFESFMEGLLINLHERRWAALAVPNALYSHIRLTAEVFASFEQIETRKEHSWTT